MGSGVMRKSAFTLIELLSSTAIIAVLMALMFPLFVQVKNKVFAYTAGSSMRQVGMSSSIYRMEWDGFFPNPQWSFPGDPQDINGDGTVEWYEKLLPYFEYNRRILRVNADLTDPDLRPSSFAVNSWFDYSFSESSVGDPAGTIYATERNNDFKHDFIEWWHWQKGVWPPDPNAIPFAPASESVAIFRYQGFNNYLYVDGHARMRKFEDTWYPRVSWWPDAPPEVPSGSRF